SPRANTRRTIGMATSIWLCEVDKSNGVALPTRRLYVQVSTAFEAKRISRRELRSEGYPLRIEEVLEQDVDPLVRFIRAEMGKGADGRPELIETIVRRAHRSEKRREAGA